MADGIREEAREVPVVSRVDVAVVGGGCAGLGAAIAAARNGARVALVERLGFLGGCVTATMMDVLWMFRAGNRKAVEGIGMEMLRRLKEQGGVDGEPGHRVYVDTERFKLLADQMVEESGVELWLHALGVSPIVEGDALSGVIVESKSGRQAIRAGVVVDASGDGDMAARAGASYEMGRPEDGRVQPVSSAFRLTNVDLEAVRSYWAQHPDDLFFARLVKVARERGDFTVPRTRIIFHGVRPWGELTGINATRVFVQDPTDSRQLTAAELENRRQVYQVADFLRKYVPGFAGCEVSYIATQVAARESRRILGEYTLTEDDIARGAEFTDAVARYPCFLDIHNPAGIDTRLLFPRPENPGDDPLLQAWSTGDPNSCFESGIRPARLSGGYSGDPVETAPSALFDIPYRCLVPLRVEGVLTSGRCISATHVALGSVRYLAASFATGQAAGTAAAMAALGNLRPRQVEVAALRGRLVEQGAYL